MFVTTNVKRNEVLCCCVVWFVVTCRCYKKDIKMRWRASKIKILKERAISRALRMALLILSFYQAFLFDRFYNKNNKRSIHNLQVEL